MLIALIVILLLGTAAFFIDRLLVWMEKRGWINYRQIDAIRRKGSAVLEVQSLFEPDKKYVLEIMQKEEHEQSESGAPPDPDLSKKDAPRQENDEEITDST